jgi:acetyl-CoA acetyltransferase
MPLARRAYIAGGSITSFVGKGHPDFIWKKHPDFGKRENPTLEDLLTQAVLGAISDTGVDPLDIDRCMVGNFVGELFCQQGHLGAAMIGAHPGLAGKPSVRLEGACASGGLAMMAGLDAIAAGADMVLVAGVEVQTTESARTGADYLARASHYRRQRSIDEFTFPALFARRTKACFDAWGWTDDDLAHVAVKAYQNANRNPLAHMQSREMPFELASNSSEMNPNFLANEELKPYLKVSDCSQVSDGAAALLLVSEAGLNRLRRTAADCVEVIGAGQAVASLYEDGDPTRLDTTRLAVNRATGSAGITTGDIGVAEVHDCFTVTELLMMEALGLCGPGQSAAMVKDGATQIDGRFPVNTGGGLVGFGHPVGATGVKQALEIFRQMKGLCGDYQMPCRPTVGVTANMGGDDKTVVSMVLRAGQ